MKIILKYMKPYASLIALVIIIKLAGTLSELLLPYVLEYMIDEAVPNKDVRLIIICGILMLVITALTYFLNVIANRQGVTNSHNATYDLRKDLFHSTANLSGKQFDHFGLPSLISRMTSDSYNVQTCITILQLLCIRAPMMLIGGIIITSIMDAALAKVLRVMVPVLVTIIISVSYFGIPLYAKVQKKLDDITRIMRENITGIRVVKALSKTEYEKKRFAKANEDMAATDIKASTIMAIPGPLMSVSLNVGLVIVIILGAQRIDQGIIKPGVVLAFLTYFNMIMMGVMGLNRIFVNVSKASASANRIGEVIAMPLDADIIPLEAGLKPSREGHIVFDHVAFSYNKTAEQTLEDIDFVINKGESLGIIGPTGSGKSTILSLLLHFYDADKGGVFVDGRDVRTYPKDELHRKFGCAFQYDAVFNDSLENNISFGRHIPKHQLLKIISDAQAEEFISEKPGGLDYIADIKGANLSGGQKQRLLISRALAAHPDVLILDDSSSALDYKTDSLLRKAIDENHSASTLIMVAQRVSSVMNMTNIMVLDNGRCIGYGNHRYLLDNCAMYKEIYESQMGSIEE